MSLRRTDCLLTKKKFCIALVFFWVFNESFRPRVLDFPFVSLVSISIHIISLFFIIILLLYPLLRFRVFLSRDTKSPSYGPGCLWLAVCPVLPTYPSPCFIICFTPRCTFHNSDSPIECFFTVSLPAQSLYLLLFYRLNVSQKCTVRCMKNLNRTSVSNSLLKASDSE